ncbi:SAM-dependent DNA methyltransferase [Campylobacter upsaliensis]|nr:SAM-dependent DNA methyltransferase [Campylobacter upsaliensis]
MSKRTEDEVRDYAKKVLGFDDNEKDVKQGAGQTTTFNQLGFKGIKDKPDGWYLPNNPNDVAIVLETKAEKIDIDKHNPKEDIEKYTKTLLSKYNKVVGVLYNGNKTRVFLNGTERQDIVDDLQPKSFYLKLFNINKIDKNQIYKLTKRINNSLHFQFGVKNLYHRMVFTACALVAQRYGGELIKIKNLGYASFHTRIHTVLSKALQNDRQTNNKLDLLLEVFSEIKMNYTENQEVINEFIDSVCKISECVNSDFWQGEDVMGIFFNEFNRYKKKSDNGQVFTPDHITSLMYRIIDINANDYVFDGACGSGAFLVKAMSNMIKEVGGVNASKAKTIKENHLYGIEFDREIYALACANMMIHKDGKTNLAQLDTRSDEAKEWIKTKLSEGASIKVLMNPPFERKYGCMKIVQNILDSVPTNSKCAFILPDKKLEKDNGKKLLQRHRLEKIIKLPEKTFKEGVTTSIFIFTSGVPQENKEIFACYIEYDGLENVKNQGRQDVKYRWQEIENRWTEIIRKQSGDETIQWIKPSEFLSYQMPQKPFEIKNSDFKKTMIDYLMFQRNIDTKKFKDELYEKIITKGKISKDKNQIVIKLEGNSDEG